MDIEQQMNALLRIVMEQSKRIAILEAEAQKRHLTNESIEILKSATEKMQRQGKDIDQLTHEVDIITDYFGSLMTVLDELNKQGLLFDEKIKKYLTDSSGDIRKFAEDISKSG